MNLWKKLRRPDWLGELQGMLVLALVFVGVIGALGVADAARGTVTIPVPADRVTGALDHELRDGAAIAPAQDLTVVVANPDLTQRLTNALTVAPSFLAVAAMLVLLLRLLHHARRVDPFTRVTVRRLRVLAAVALGGGFLAFMVETIATLHLTGLVVADGIFASISVGPYWLLVFFGLLAVAEVVNRGCAMRDELETVV